MTTLRLLYLFLLLFSLTSGKQEYQSIGDFVLESGETIENCIIGYQRFGSVNSDSSNIVIVPTWFSGISDHVANLVGEDNLYDSTRYHIIILDALGNGISTSPKDYTFPWFTIRDMVESQYQLLHNTLGITHIHAVAGGSMGGMQVFQWVVSYPNYMDKAISYTGTPWPTSHSLFVWKSEKEIIDNGIQGNRTTEEIGHIISRLQVLSAYSPDYHIRTTPSDDSDVFLSSYTVRFLSTFSPFNWTYQLHAMIHHDIRNYVDGAEMKSILDKTDLLVITASQDQLVPPHNAIQFANTYSLQLVEFDNDCGHLAPGCEKERLIGVFNDHLK